MSELAPPPTPAYRLTVTKVTSFVVFTSRRSVTKVGSVEELERFARSVRIHNLLAGWWGFPFGLIWTPMNLSRNAAALTKLHELAQSGKAAAGWFPDPSGRHPQRFWDGNAWTDEVRDVTADPLNP